MASSQVVDLPAVAAVSVSRAATASLSWTDLREGAVTAAVAGRSSGLSTFLVGRGSFGSEVAPGDVAAVGATLARRPAASAGAYGIPAVALDAYRTAADDLARTDPQCGLPWWLLAGIGRIESGHAAGGRVDAHGTTRGPILGPRLDGSMPGTAVIHDSDGGRLDGDPVFDRAVGPMQFLPQTWAAVAADGNGDGVANPHNVYDAALGAGRYLCSGGAQLSSVVGLTAAVLRYNHSMSYVESVLGWGVAYRDGVSSAAGAPGPVPAVVNPRQAPDLPPAARTADQPAPAPSSNPDTAPVLADGARVRSSTQSPSSTSPLSRSTAAPAAPVKQAQPPVEQAQPPVEQATTPPPTKPLARPPSTKPLAAPPSTKPPVTTTAPTSSPPASTTEPTDEPTETTDESTEPCTPPPDTAVTSEPAGTSPAPGETVLVCCVLPSGSNSPSGADPTGVVSRAAETQPTSVSDAQQDSSPSSECCPVTPPPTDAQPTGTPTTTPPGTSTATPTGTSTATPTVGEVTTCIATEP